MTMKSPFIIYDYQIFEMQRFGGISRYFCEIIKRISAKHKITVRYSINYYLTSWMLERSLILLPRFIYKRYRSFFQKKNHNITKKLLKTSGPYLLHPTYYDPYFLDYIGENPYIITVHDMIHEKFPQYVTDANITINHKKEVITRANRIIAISENTKKDIIEIFNINPQKIDVIYHSTSMKCFLENINYKYLKDFYYLSVIVLLIKISNALWKHSPKFMKKTKRYLQFTLEVN